jgi:two-component system NtrC family sensor kinase
MVFVFSLPVYIQFVHYFLGISRRRWLEYLAYGFSAVFLILTPTDLFIKGFAQFDFGIIAQAGKAFHFFTALVSFTVCYCLFTLFMGMKKTRENQKRNRIKYILWGLGLSSFLIALNILPVSGFNVYPLGNFSFIPAIVLAFGVLKYDLLDMGAVIRRGTIYFLLTIVLTLFYVIIIGFFNTLFIRSGQTHPLLLPFVLSLFMVILFNPIREKVRMFIDKLFFRGKYDYQRLLKEVSAQMTKLLRIDDVTELLLKSVEESLQTDNVVLFLLDEKSARFQAKHLGGNTLAIPWAEIDQHHPLAVYLEDFRRPLSTVLIELSGLPKHQKADIIDLIRAWRSSLVVPMYSKGRLIGIITLGQKKSGELFVHEDVELLSTLANQTATALDNAKMYNELEELNRALERKVEERTADLRQALAEKERTQKQLIQSESLAAIGQLVAGTAHELNNPLASAASLLQNSAETIRDWPETFKEREEVIDDLTFSLKELKRAGDIVKSLLGLSRQTQTYVEPVNINAVIDDALRVLHNQFKTLPVSIEKTYEEGLPPVEGNFANLGQVFINIIKNALQSLPEGKGVINLKTSYQGETDSVIFACRDTGEGIPEAYLKDIFKPFFTSKPLGRGTGLGLYISHEIIKRHGGDISVSTEPGKGSVFVIELPCKRRER